MWSKKYELQYWNAEGDQYYIDNIKQKYAFFEVDNFIKDEIEFAVDIGGGKFGGALYFLNKARHYILVDALAKEFREMNCLPYNVDSITADFSNIPLEDCCADVVFAWNVFDHANDEEHFIKGFNEAERILKANGLFFGSFPLRKKLNEGHPICIDRKMVGANLNNFSIIEEFSIREPYRDETLFVIARKNL